MSENLSINDLARISRMSPSHFIRAFTLTFGMPPHQYLVNLRLKMAEKQLIETKLPISDIAFQTGFSSQSHLTNTMKRFKQLTPGKIRSAS
ncbi:helix-turn-helix domain-containing protein [Phyllobacterium zundukense]|uniref:AraC family transcriptional regulator n=1 Tax=Phyllobacterium zundukense TaxID=1867719 RepID=A0ACD4D9I6_9HYPH|nr:AraC family transcriptional regulator [Phyllobacterium zundukense]UXN62335.1 AraC family transcriptional regulator [Phyllobacterium zundukense]